MNEDGDADRNKVGTPKELHPTEALESVNERIKTMKDAGIVKKMLENIHINSELVFDENRKHSSLPPKIEEAKREEASIWGYSWQPELCQFDQDRKYENKTYNTILFSDRNFQNPYAVHNMVQNFDIHEYSSLAMDFSFPPEEDYNYMRNTQNQIWAEQRLRRGVEYQQLGKLNDALRCYMEAIDLVPTFADAHTAKGTVLVKMGKYKDSIACFELALNLDPSVPNAANYLEKARVMMKESSINIRSKYDYHTNNLQKSQEKEVKKANSKEEIDMKLLELLKQETERSRETGSHSHRRNHSHSRDSSSRKHHRHH